MAKKKRRKPRPRKKNNIDIRSFFEKITDSLRYNRSLYIIIGIVVALFIVGLLVFTYIRDNYTITNVYVTGNTHYTNEEVIDMVMTDKFCHNSLYLSLKYMNKSIEGVPFVEKMSVEIVSPDTVRINVYEKAVAGYISYLGHYIYFDRDGIVVESSLEASDDVPEVLGLSFSYVVLYEKLPIDNEEVFEEILDITQLLSKYNLKANKIFFDSEYNLYLYFDGIEVSIGTKDYIDEKIIQLQYILPKLEGKTGLLEMKDYDEDTKNVTFQEKKQ